VPSFIKGYILTYAPKNTKKKYLLSAHGQRWMQTDIMTSQATISCTDHSKFLQKPLTVLEQIATKLNK